MSAQVENDLLAQVMGRCEAKAGVAVAETAAASSPELSSERFADCLYRSAKNVFSTMCGLELGSLTVAESASPRHPLSGIVSISGAIKATIVINLPTKIAIKAAAGLLGTNSTELDGDVIDAIAELANMVGGNTKSLLGIPGGHMSMPTVVKGPDHTLLLGSKMEQRALVVDVDGVALRLEFILGDD